jgi:hypothetical protein
MWGAFYSHSLLLGPCVTLLSDADIFAFGQECTYDLISVEVFSDVS